MAKVTDTVAQLALPFVESAGCSLWDVEYVKEAGEWFLRIYIDKEGGVSIEDCEAVSRPLSDKLDEADPIGGSYTFRRGGPRAEKAGALRPVPGQRGGGPSLPGPGRPEGFCGPAPVLAGRRRGPGGGRTAHVL